VRPPLRRRRRRRRSCPLTSAPRSARSPSSHASAEHYAFKEGDEQETYSYYGPLNLLAYNVGYHNEHHDFPNVPWTRLPSIKALAPEWYADDQLKSHESWPLVTWRFITDENVGMFSRIKRENLRGD
jgi:sphingolipid delta-4 desaturase